MSGERLDLLTVVDYFGKFFETDEEIKKMINKINETNGTFFQKMNGIREELIKEGKEVPFRARYWRFRA
jgi:hypothetical protein